MVHQYKSNGYNIVLDVCSGSVHVVDDLVYDIIANYENHTKEQVMELLPSYDKDEVSEAYDEVTGLVEDGTLFTEDMTVILHADIVLQEKVSTRVTEV